MRVIRNSVELAGPFSYPSSLAWPRRKSHWPIGLLAEMRALALRRNLVLARFFFAADQDARRQQLGVSQDVPIREAALRTDYN